MKPILFILCIFCLAPSCKKEKHVVCHCIGTPNLSFDYGYQKNPNTTVEQARCDSDGVHNGHDTCIALFETQ